MAAYLIPYWFPCFSLLRILEFIWSRSYSDKTKVKLNWFSHLLLNHLCMNTSKVTQYDVAKWKYTTCFSFFICTMICFNNFVGCLNWLYILCLKEKIWDVFCSFCKKTLFLQYPLSLATNERFLFNPYFLNLLRQIYLQSASQRIIVTFISISLSTGMHL